MKCKDCRYYAPGAESHSAPSDATNWGASGECRRYPPTVHPDSESDTIRWTWWPDVEENQWCGEFEAKSQQELDIKRHQQP